MLTDRGEASRRRVWLAGGLAAGMVGLALLAAVARFGTGRRPAELALAAATATTPPLVGTLVFPSGAGASATPAAPPPMWRATEAGCCPLPFWSADSKSVLFWYAPPDGPPGVYGVPVEGASPAFVAARPAAVFASGAFTSRRQGTVTELRRVADGRRWPFDLGPDGWLALAPDGRHIATARQIGRFVPGNAPPPVRYGQVDLETGAATEVEVPDGYALVGWTADGRWLMTLIDGDEDKPGLIRFDPAAGVIQSSVPTGTPTEPGAAGPSPDQAAGAPVAAESEASSTSGTPLAAGAESTAPPIGLTHAPDPASAMLGRLRSARLSPGGKWIAYLRAFETKPENNGIFIVSTRFDSPPRRLDPRLIGGFRWRDADRLLVVPQTPGYASMALWQVDAASGTVEDLIDSAHPDARPLRIAAGEWSVSPDGHHVAYRHASDDTVWVILLP